MNNDTTVIKGTRATLAWLGIVITLLIVAAVGILCGHESTATAVLAATAIWIGLFSALATLNSRKRTVTLLAVTAALSAAAGLLVIEADAIRQIVTEPDAKTATVTAVLVVIISLTIVIFRCNGENDELENQSDQTSLGTATNEDKPDV